jgi:hypothetical protein
MTLERLVLDYRGGELAMRVLYRSEDGPGPNTKARRREVEELAREGLRQALASLEGDDVAMCGTSGFTQREDVLSLPPPDEPAAARRAAS